MICLRNLMLDLYESLSEEELQSGSACLYVLPSTKTRHRAYGLK